VVFDNLPDYGNVRYEIRHNSQIGITDMNFNVNIKSIVWFVDPALSLRLGMRLNRKEKGEDGVVLRTLFYQPHFPRR